MQMLAKWCGQGTEGKEYTLELVEELTRIRILHQSVVGTLHELYLVHLLPLLLHCLTSFCDQVLVFRQSHCIDRAEIWIER